MPITRGGNQGPEKLSNLPEIAQLVNVRLVIRPDHLISEATPLAPESCAFPH